MKRKRTIASFWLIGLFLFGIIAAAERAEAQDQALEVSDVQFNSEGETVFGASAPTDHFKSLAEKEPSAAHYPDRMRTRGVPSAEDPAYYRSVSAIYHANEMRNVPILLIHGAQDFLTFVDHSTNMYRALKVAGNREARIEVIVGAGHFFERGMRGYAFDEVLGHTLPWFDRTLRGAK